MYIEFLVEEPSAEAALNILVPRIVGPDISFKVHPYQGKPDLLAKLPARLQGYRNWMPEDWRVVVIVDGDSEDCKVLKGNLEGIAARAGLITKTTSGGARFHVLNRLAIEELEAWFLGDVEALCAAYPGVDRNLSAKEKYRDPDAILGGTWEAMERVLRAAGHFRGGLGKVTAAREIANFMEPERNRSRSFQTFRQGLLEMIA